MLFKISFSSKIIYLFFSSLTILPIAIYSLFDSTSFLKSLESDSICIYGAPIIVNCFASEFFSINPIKSMVVGPKPYMATFLFE